MVAEVMDDEAVATASISEMLDRIHVCKVCQLRIGSSGSSFSEYELEETPVSDGMHCSACLGILEGFSLKKKIEDVIETLQHDEYDSPTFSLGISVPPCVRLREMAVRAYLIDNGLEDFPPECPTVKTVAKFFICQMMENLTGKEFDAASGLYLKFDFQFKWNTKELASLGVPQHSGGRKRDKKGKPLPEPNYHNAISKVSLSSIKRHAPVPPQALQEACRCVSSVSSTSMFVGGRYNKYSRSLSQTPWFIDGTRRGETSVLELIGEPLKRFTRGNDIKFLSSGREDIDVRMLGNGRPFAVEILNPKKTMLNEEEIQALKNEINSSTDQVAVNDLQTVSKADLEIMKKGEEEKSKRYSAKLWCPEKITDEQLIRLNSLKTLELNQRTPIRVLHRRPLATRVRQVYEFELKRTSNERYYQLDLDTQAGTYIKELVHGDLGRTEPSLRTLLGLPIDIVELDVLSINLDWPPAIP